MCQSLPSQPVKHVFLVCVPLRILSSICIHASHRPGCLFVLVVWQLNSSRVSWCCDPVFQCLCGKPQHRPASHLCCSSVSSLYCLKVSCHLILTAELFQRLILLPVVAALFSTGSFLPFEFSPGLSSLPSSGVSGVGCDFVSAMAAEIMRRNKCMWLNISFQKSK